jgi:hypothetical protein
MDKLQELSSFAEGVEIVSEIKIVGRGVDTLVLNVSYTDK